MPDCFKLASLTYRCLHGLAVFYLHLPMTDGELRRLSLSIISHIIMMIVYRMRVSMIVDLTFPVATFVFETLDMLIVSL